nr:cytidine deaminase [Saprospiraceae bacterium]
MCKNPLSREKTIKYTEYPSADQLSREDIDLLTRAWNQTQNAYAPYSHFKVGACLSLEDGTTISGSNQENASYPAGLCAERVALFSAAGTHPGKKIIALAISAKNQTNDLLDPVFPCGFCLQVLVEMERKQQKPIRLIIGNPNTRVLVFDSGGDMMPFAFDAEQL